MKKLLVLCFVLGQFSVSSAAKELFVQYPHLLTRDSSTTFHIASQYEDFDSSIRSFCLQASSQHIDNQLVMRPCCEHGGTACDPTSFQLQQWFMDPLGQLRLKSYPPICIKWGTNLEKKELRLGDDCPNESIDPSLIIYTFIFDIQKHEIYAVQNKKVFWLRPNKSLSKFVRLYASESGEEINKWFLKSVIYSSEQPSYLPSTNPTLTQLPSMQPSTSPSDSPSDEPSVSPSDCMDEAGWTVGGTSDFKDLTCTNISEGSLNWCQAIMDQTDTSNLGKSVNEACCVCGGSTYKTTYPSSEPSSFPTVSSSPSIEPMTSAQPSLCIDEPDWYFYPAANLTCSHIKVSISDIVCERFKNTEYDGKTIVDACCICGGGKHQSRQPSGAPSYSAAPSPLPSTSINPSDSPTKMPSSIPSISTATSISTAPSISTEPSIFSYLSTVGIFDDKPCKYSHDCKSGDCTEEGLCATGVSFYLNSPFSHQYLSHKIDSFVFEY